MVQMNGLQKSAKKFKLEKVLKDDSLNYVLVGIKARRPPLIQLANTTCKSMELDNLKRNKFANEEDLEEFMLPVLLKYESLCNQIPFKYVCICGQAGLQYNYIIVHKDKIASGAGLADLLVVGSSCFKSVSIMVPSSADTCFKKCAGHIHGFNPDCKFKINSNINSIQSFLKNALMRGDEVKRYYNSKLWKLSGLCYDCKNIYVGELMRPFRIGGSAHSVSINAYTMLQTEKNKNNLLEYYNYLKERQLHNKKENRIQCLMICFTKKLLASYAELAMSDNLLANN